MDHQQNQQPGKLSGLRVSHLMSTNVICLEENDSIAFTIKVFDRCHISGAPVKNMQGEYVGVISKTDLFDRRLLDFLNQHGNLEELPVRYIMSDHPPMSVPESTTVEKAAELMLQNRMHRVFVRDTTDKIIGVVSSFDVMRVVASNNQASAPVQKEQQLQNIRDHLSKSKAR